MRGLDFETFSSVSLPKHGADRYFASPDFQILVAAVASQSTTVRIFDFVMNPGSESRLERAMQYEDIAAHNSSFEEQAARRAGLSLLSQDMVFVDTAVIARAMGAGGRLEAAAPQLLTGRNKMEVGKNLIQTFCVPTEANGGKPYTKEAILADADLLHKWELFKEYCGIDAILCLDIADQYNAQVMLYDEPLYNRLTTEMNETGWFVDLPLVHRMQKVYECNTAALESEFRMNLDPKGALNLRSFPQLQRWCAERGVKAKSFDKLSMEKLQRQLLKRLSGPILTTEQHANYCDVLDLIVLKQELGGSSLSKLQTIIDMTGEDGRLRGQYMHIGAGQTYRTSGRGVQLQNLARLDTVIGDMSELDDPDTCDWDNTKLAHNIRQVFKAEHPDGELIVGDFGAIESRGLAYLSGERWKLSAYRDGRDVYKMLAMTYQSNAGVMYDDVTAEQRRGGKVGELACGYGAGPAAVQSFAEKMGIDMDLQEAETITRDWRDANQNIKKFWDALDKALREVVVDGQARWVIPLDHDRGQVTIRKIYTPLSLLAQHPDAMSIELSVGREGRTWLSRIFHGCYMRGNDICYYKPSELKSGDLWRARMTTPPHAWYKLYGGKLAGILTQSFCREIFFESMHRVSEKFANVSNVKMIGQFHDELVLEWTPPDSGDPNGISLQQAIRWMNVMMSQTVWSGFPITTDVKHGHRYIK